MRKQSIFGSHFLDDFHERNSRFAIVPRLNKKNVFLRARFPVRRVVFETTGYATKVVELQQNGDPLGHEQPEISGFAVRIRKRSSFLVVAFK